MKTLQKFKKKSITVDALQNNGLMTSIFEANEFLGEDVLFPYMMNPGKDTLHIKNPDGSLTAWKNGDWVVKDNGHVYVVPKDLFELTYVKDENGN